MKARQLLQAIVADRVEVPGGGDPVGWMRFLGEGVYHRAFHGHCWLDLDGRVKEVPVVVRWPRRGGGKEQGESARREDALLRHLATLDLPISVPRSLALVSVDTGIATVQTAVFGIEMPSRTSGHVAGRMVPDMIAEVAGVVHHLDPTPLIGILDTHASRQAHAESWLKAIDPPERTEAADAVVWLREHLPPKTPPRLLHGDLLPQNLRIDPEQDGKLGVVDWTESIIGDPAYELAIITRGGRRPFGDLDGLRRLLDAYNPSAPELLKREDVGVYEVLLKLGWAVGRERDDPGSLHAEQGWWELAGLLRRLA